MTGREGSGRRGGAGDRNRGRSGGGSAGRGRRRPPNYGSNHSSGRGRWSESGQVPRLLLQRQPTTDAGTSDTDAHKDAKGEAETQPPEAARAAESGGVTSREPPPSQHPPQLLVKPAIGSAAGERAKPISIAAAHASKETAVRSSTAVGGREGAKDAGDLDVDDTKKKIKLPLKLVSAEPFLKLCESGVGDVARLSKLQANVADALAVGLVYTEDMKPAADRMIQELMQYARGGGGKKDGSQLVLSSAVSYYPPLTRISPLSCFEAFPLLSINRLQALNTAVQEYQSRDPASAAHGGRLHTPSAMTMLSAQNALEGETMQILSALYALCDVVVVIPSDVSDMRLLKLVAQFLRLRPGVLRGAHEKAFARTLFSPVLKLCKDDIFSDARADALEATIEEVAPVACGLVQRVSGLSPSDVEDIIKIGPLVISMSKSGNDRSQDRAEPKAKDTNWSTVCWTSVIDDIIRSKEQEETETETAKPMKAEAALSEPVDSQPQEDEPSAATRTAHNGELASDPAPDPDPKPQASNGFVERRKKTRQSSGWDWTEALAGFRAQVTQWAYQCRVVRDRLGYYDKVQGTRGSKKKDLAKTVKGVWDAVVLDNYTIQQWLNRRRL